MSNKNLKEKNEGRLIEAAWLYYEIGLNQQQISKRMMVSRATVGRFLQQALETGIVKIKITKPLPRQIELEETILKKFNLSQILIVESGATYQNTRELLAKAASDFFINSLFPGCNLGLAWSNTLSLMVDSLNNPEIPANVSIHELVGTILSVNTNFSISSRLADRLGVPLEKIPVPVLVSSKHARDVILQEKNIAQALINASKVDLAFVGLGSIDQDSSLIKTGYIDINQISEMSRRGAEGEVLFHFYNRDGKKIISQDLEERTIGIKWLDFLGIKNVIAVATGANKVKPILGALRGNLINGLITDVETAQSVIAINGD